MAGLLWLPLIAKAQTVEDGSAEHPFLIENEQELWDFHDCMLPGSQFYFYNGSYQMTRPDGTEGTDFFVIPTGGRDTYFKLTADIVINRGNVAGCGGIKDSTWRAWPPMEVFNGHFDGGHHVVSGIFCTSRYASALNQRDERGFFTQVADYASVKHLGITNAYISGGKAVGGIAGWQLRNAVIEECFFEGTLESSDTYSGGITGIADGNSQIRNCYSTGHIYAQKHFVGGICGRISSGTKILNCYSNMIMESDGSLTGAICGYMDDSNSGIYGLCEVENSFYDKQMSLINTNMYATGLLTSEMATSTWTDLGDKFVPTNGLYPHIDGFSLDSPSVAMSVIPIFLEAISTMQYDDVDHVDQDFGLGTRPGATWTATSWNDCMTADNENLQAVLHKEGIADLVVQMDTLTRTYVLIPHKAPFLGSEENPFLIENLEHLTTFRDGINGGVDFIFRRFKVDYNNLENIHWKQVNDIDMSSVPNWTPIGISTLPFIGYYHGNNAKIKNFHLPTGAYKALFAYVRKSLIEDLIFENVNVNGTGNPSAVLCANNMYGHIKNCHILGGSIVSNSTNFGGLCGTSEKICIRNCSVENVAMTFKGTQNGGIIGWGNQDTIVNCYVSGGSITANSTYNGAIAGYLDANVAGSSSLEAYGCIVDSCYNATPISGTGSQIGGLCGFAYDATRFIHCYNLANIKLSGKNYIGGICGSLDNGPQFRYCYNAGNIEGNNYIGGIIGYDGTGLASVSYSNFNTGTIKGNTYVGGIIGDALASPWSDLLNAGMVIGSSYVGGIEGHSTGGTYQRTINVGQVIGTTINYVGAILGYPNSNFKNSRNDQQMCLYGAVNGDNSGTMLSLNTNDMLGEGLKSLLGTTEWEYTDGLYPRIKYWKNADAAIAAASPVFFSSEDENAENVKINFNLGGCDSNVVWTIDSGVVVTNIDNLTCSDNKCMATISTGNVIPPSFISATIDGVKYKTIRLYKYVEPCRDTLTIDSLGDWITLRNGINSDVPFYYHDHLICRHADQVHFRQTTDIEFPNSNWEPIGGNSYFSGIILGDGYTISNLHCNSTYAGLFLYLKGRVQDLNMTNCSITGGAYRGALCAKLLNGKVLNCTAEGTITGGGVAYNNEFYTGGLVGWSAGKDTIQNCESRVSITTTGNYAHSGGIVGQANGNTRILNCDNFANISGTGTYSISGGIAGYGGVVNTAHNEGKITGNYRVGGIIGEGGTAQICYNTGDVYGNSSCEYTGGISGTGTTVTQCYNVATVTAKPGNSTSNHYVGGVCGSGNPSYSYNAGIVYGNNRKYVGGICGSGNPSYCYNSNTARSTGTQLGAVVATGTPNHCYYDKQLCPEGGINRADAAGKAEGKTTAEMLTEGLKTLLVPSGSASPWTWGHLLYPQLTAFAGTDPSISSVMPVRLSNEETWKQVSSNFYMHGCEVGDWELLQGSCIELDTTGTNCQTSVVGTGIAQLGAAVNGQTYRKVRLLVQVNEHTPLIIKNLTELKNFRNVINSAVGYYSWADSTYHTTLSNEDSLQLEDFVEIQNGGLDLYFKQVVDIDMSRESGSWTPIADYQTNNSWLFQGNYNGDGHTISGLKLTANSNYRGLFGRTNSAVIRNLTIDASQMSSNSQHKGILCGMNYGGLIDNCAVTHSKVTGGSTYTGVLCGSNYYGDIRHCNVTSDTLQSTGERAGGICGYNEYGVIDSCYSEKLYVTGAGAYKGGIAGYNYRGNVTYCHIANSYFNVSGEQAGGICGRNHGEGATALVANCYNLNTEMHSTANYLGGIDGYQYHTYSTTRNCYVTGGTIQSNKSYVGGIIGYQYYNVGNNYVKNCYNENSITGASYVGGITGESREANVDTCTNRGEVYATSSLAGGIVGYVEQDTRIQYVVNEADVRSAGANAGGIVGSVGNNTNTRVLHSYNLGQVKGTNRVGGIIGWGNMAFIQKCYNVGIVNGVSQVGGLIGAQSETASSNSSNSYNAGWVYGVSMVGAICGYSPVNKFANCAYDLQMCPRGGVNDVDIAATKPLLTTELASNSDIVKNILGTTDWVYTEGMYPRLTKIDTGRAALASALPLYLTVSAEDTVRANDVPVRHYTLTGCDQNVNWIRHEGYGLTITDCDLNATGRNYVQIANVIDDDTLKVIQLVLGISEENPLEIVSLEQFRKFRDLINSNQTFYFDDVNKIFYESEGEGYIKIDPLGEHMFFKLTTDIDLSLESGGWKPIGDYATSTQLMFKGHFNGDNHNIVGLTIPNSSKSYQGLFGYLQGTMKNVRVVNADITGSGSYYGVIAGYNNGTVLNCISVDGRIKSTGSYIGGITGINVYDQVSYCYNSCNITGVSYVGGISGQSKDAGVVSQCFNAGMVTATATNGYVGGIAGYCNTELTNCYNVGAITGKNYMGGIVGWSQSQWTRYCYNAGYVKSLSATPSYVGAIASSDNSSYYPYYSFYDKQMCTLDGGIGRASDAINSANRTADKFTTDMVGAGLSGTNMLSSTYWTFTDSIYPRLTSMLAYDGSSVSAQPVFVSDLLGCDEIATPFTVKTNDSITWSRHGNGHALNVNNIADGQVSLAICGEDTLKISLRNDIKLVPVEVVKLAAYPVVDTACDGFYVWAANGRVYTESCEVTIALTVTEGCDSIMKLKLTIPPALNIEMDAKNYTCYESDDAYAEATVTGGFERGYLYFWTNAAGDTIGTTNRIDNPTPGTYHLSVRDQVHPDCEKSTDVTITRPEDLVLTPLSSDGQCYNQNDGYIEFSVEGGSMPYKVDWETTDTITVSRAATDTITGLAAGTYTVQVTDAHGCTKTSESITLEEDATEYIISAFGVNKMYDGVAVNPNQYILKIGENEPDTIASGAFKVLTNGDTLRATVSYAGTSVKDVMSAANEVTAYSISKNGVDKTCRYNITTQNSNIIISKRDVTLTSASAQKVHDGTALTNHTVTISGSGFAAGEDTLSCTVTGTRTDAGASANTFTYTLKENTLESNYDITTVEGQLVVVPAGSVLVVANSNTKKYDGTALVDSGYTYILPAAGTEFANDTLIVKVIGEITNVGTVVNRVDSATIVIKDKTNGTIHTSSYTIAPVVHGTLTVTKRNVTLSTVSDGKVYDGTPLARPEVTISGDGFVEGEVTSYEANNSITNVDTVTNAITVTTGAGYLAENYNLEKREGTLAVTKRQLTIIGETRSIDYDGQPHTLTTFTSPNLVAGHTITGITYAASGTQTGTYTGGFSGTAVIKDAGNNNVTANYDVTTQSGTLTIGQTILPLVVKSNTNSFMYDGQPHSYQDYTVLYNGESLSPTSGTTYTLPTGDALTITPTLTGSTGITHVSQNAEKNNTFTISLEHSDHYSVVTLDTGKIVIDKRMVILRSQNDWKIYDGTPLPTFVASTDQTVERSGYGFPVGESVVCTITGTQTNVGSSPNTFNYAAGNNTVLNDYDIVTNFGTLKVDPATLTFTATDASRMYGVENPEFEYTITGFVNHEDTTVAGHAPFLGTARPQLSTTAVQTSPAGIYDINVDLTGVEFTNYEVVPQNGKLTVNRRPLTIQALSVDHVTYDGNQHTWQESDAPHYEIVGGSSLLAHDTVTSVHIAGARTVAGTTQIELNNVMVKHYVVDGTDTIWNDVTQSYEPEYLNGTLTIDPVEITLQPLPFDTVFTGTTYTSANSLAPHYKIASGHLVGNDSIVAMTINGSRAAYGKTPFVIDSVSIKIVDTTEVHDYTDLTPQQLRNAGYHITLLTDTLNVEHRTEPYEIEIFGKKDTLVYNGQDQTLTGWRENEFVVNGYTYHVETLTSSITKQNVGVYPTVISGDTVVKNANNEDVSAEFHVTAHPGELTITKKPLTVTAKGVTVEYDFILHSYADNNPPYTTDGLCGGHTISAIQMTGETTQGRAPIHIVENSVQVKTLVGSIDVTNNYEITTVDSAINILPRTQKDTFRIVSKSQTIVYDGAPHTLTGFDTLRFMLYSHTAQETPVYFTIDPASVTATTIAATNVGTYKNVITGTPSVLDENNNDVSEYFVVLADTGTLTINQRPITVTGRDSTFYFDGNSHSIADMHAPYHTIDSTQLVSGHNLTAEVTSETISELDATTSTVVGEVTITDAGSNNVTTNYDITKVNGLLKIEGFPGTIVITSASAELECTGLPQKKDEYTVTYAGTPLTAVTGSNGLKFAMPTATHDTLTITPTFAGITIPSENADSNNVYTYALQNDTKYVGTRTLVKGTIVMYDSLKVVVSDTAVTCYNANDGKAKVTITGGKKNAGNYSYTLDGGTATTTTGTVNLTALANGSHTFYVSDSLSYNKTVTFTITQPDTLTLTLTSDNPVCDDGSVMSFTTGGNGGNTYQLNDVDTNAHLFNHLPAGTYTVKVTDSKGCSATQSVTLEPISVTAKKGITRAGEITSYAPQSTVDRNGRRVPFPALTANGEIIAQPALSNCTAAVAGHTVTITVNVDSVGALPILVFELSPNEGFSTDVPMYTHKVAPVSEGSQTFNFENLPAGTYYVRAKLYNCEGGFITRTPTTATVNVE